MPAQPISGNDLARFSGPDQAAAADAALRADGILVRRVTSYGLPAALRITVGDENGCRRVVACLSRFVDAQRAAE